MRALTAPLVLAAAVGVPYAATNTDQIEQMWQGDGKPEASSLASAETLAGMPAASGLGPATPATQVRNFPLAEVIRFDVNKNWVFQRWQRKTTSLAELDLFGVRVPLITGTSLQDMAGSLTYYFDAQGLIRRISLVGTTGNTTQLETLVTQRFGLQLQGTPISGRRVYQVRQGEAVISELIIRPASVIRSNTPHESFSVDLQLQRPGTTAPLPNRTVPLDNLLSQQPQAPPDAQAPQTAQAAPAEQPAPAPAPVAEEAPDEPYWKAYFPRSRVPDKQIENLDRQNRF